MLANRRRLMILISVIGAISILVVIFKHEAVMRLVIGGGYDEVYLLTAVVFAFMIGLLTFAALMVAYRLPGTREGWVAALETVRSEAIGAGLQLLVLVIIGVPFWLIAIVVVPNFADPAPSQREVAALGQRTLQVFGEQTIRVEPRRGGNVRVYTSRARYDAIPYPDRDALMRDFAGVWCAHVQPWLLPSVVVADIKTGDRLDSCLCVMARSGRAAP